MPTAWDRELASLLEELSATQQELLDLFVQKRDLLAAANTEGLAELAQQENELLARLQSCHDRRGELLTQARDEGLPGDSIRSLAKALPGKNRELESQIAVATSRSRLLQHQGLTNWVLVQRTLIHLSQLLEILATGGRSKPTYGKTEAAHSGGALIDQAI